MRNITIDVLTFNERLRIGKQGENLTREITFDCAAWLDTLSGGVLSIVHQRPTDSDAYPCGDYTVTDTSLTWSINETDLAFSGLGRCELRYTIGSRIAKSKTFYTEIFTALNPLDTPPAAYEPYIDRVIDAARWEMDALSVGGTVSETERLSVQVDKIVPVDPDDGYEIYFRFGIPKGADGKGVSNATASVDNNTGTPSVTVTTTDTEEGMDIDFSFHNLKGATGAAGQDGDSVGTVTASVDNNTGTPSVTVTTSGGSGSPVGIDLAFHNLKGATGATGDSVGTVTASVDNNTGTPSVTVTTSGGSGSPVGIDLAFHNLKGQSFDTSFLPSDTASGSPATFPDGAKNVAVDELITTIVPQQAGSGTPSPSNPRALSGRTQAEITHNGETETIAFGQTVYGGTLNVTTGVLTITHGKYTFTGSEGWTQQPSSPNKYYSSSPGSGYLLRDALLPADNGKSVPIETDIGSFSDTYNSLHNYPDHMCIAADSRVGIHASLYNGSQTLVGITIVYELAQHSTVQLTPTEVDTILGANSISSDCGVVSVNYRADIGLYIDKKLS